MGFVDEWITRFKVEGGKSLSTAASDHAKAATSIDRSQSVWENLVGSAGKMQGWGTSLQGAANDWMNMAGQMEGSRVAFTTLLGDAGKADKMVADLRKFAATTPFEFIGLQDQTKQLLAYGFTGEEIIPMLTSVGNAAGMLGKGGAGIEYITRALGQMKAKGKISGEEIRQLAEQGIPVYDILMKKLNLTRDEMGKIGSLGISGDVGVKAILEGMSDKFGGGMAAQSKTYLGVQSNLKDSQDALKVSMGESMIGPMTEVTKGTIWLNSEVAKLPPGLRSAVGWTAYAGGGLMKYGGQVLGLIGDMKMHTAMQTLATAATARKSAMDLASVAPTTAAAGANAWLSTTLLPVALTAIAAAAAIAILIEAYQTWETLKKEKEYQKGREQDMDAMRKEWVATGGTVGPGGELRSGTRKRFSETGRAGSLGYTSTSTPAGYGEGRTLGDRVLGLRKDLSAKQQPNGNIQVQQTLNLTGGGPSQAQIQDWAALQGT